MCLKTYHSDLFLLKPYSLIPFCLYWFIFQKFFAR